MKKIDYTPKVKPSTPLRFGKGPIPSGTKAWTPVVTLQPLRSTTLARSLSTPGGSTALKQVPQYTGDKMLGVSIIHKSCLQPVFSQEAAIDAANMRR